MANKPKNRLVVVEQVYHQPVGCSPTSIDYAGFSIPLESDEQPYIRHLTIGPESIPLDCGWITECSQMVLVNHDPTHALMVDGWVVGPKQSMRGQPVNLADVTIRCYDGAKVRCTLYLFPK